jgi:hypothetical protein
MAISNKGRWRIYSKDDDTERLVLLIHGHIMGMLHAFVDMSDGIGEPHGQDETRSSCAASRLTSVENMVVVMESRQFCRKATPITLFHALCTEALGGPQRSTSSRLAALPPARGKAV